MRGVASWKGLWSILILIITALGGVQADSSYAASHLSSKETEGRGHRKLAEYQIPFSIQWRIEIGNGATDRLSTPEEYAGVVEATAGWYNEVIEAVYGDTVGMILQDFEATLTASQTSWNPGAADNYPHIITIACSAVFEATSFDVLPEPEEFLLALNANSAVSEFISDYLLDSGPSDSLFRFSERVSYQTSTTTSSGPFTPAPVQPTPPPGPTPSFTNSYVIPFKLTFALGMGNGFSDREPTRQEYEGLQASGEAWMLDSLRSAYASETESFFLNEVTSLIVSTNWDQGDTSGYPHGVVLNAYAVFDADNLASVPSLIDFFATIRTDAVSLLEFVQTYLRNTQPPDSIFRSTVMAQYTSTQNGARVPASATPSPGGAPSTSPPTQPPSAPVKRTPAPVNPNNIIATVYTESNWTYTITEEFGIVDRQPTLQEYLGLVDSTHEWLTRIFNEYYNVNNQDRNLPKFVGIETNLVRGFYRPAGPEPPHLVIINFNITFELDANDETEVVPFIDDIFGVIEQADLNQYVILYVHTSEPIATSVFHGVNSVSWDYDLSDDYTYVPRPTRPPTGSGGTGNLPVGGENTGIDRGDFQDAIPVSVALTYRYRLVDGSAGGDPSMDEWEGLLEANRNFWMDTLKNEYQSNAATNFVFVDAKWEVDSTQYVAGQDFPYSGRLLTDVLFKAGSTNVPSSIDMRSLMSSLLSSSNYIPSYIRTAPPQDNLFRQTLQIQWDF
jgi:hypothetical protein